jgi:hypothetical protein
MNEENEKDEAIRQLIRHIRQLMAAKRSPLASILDLGVHTQFILLRPVFQVEFG